MLGAEAAVLRGAEKVLKDTHVVVCEADIDDFATLHSILTEKGFVLYDITWLNYLSDGRLGWFYPVYISRALAAAQPKAFWDAKENDAVVRAQVERRQSILKWSKQLLEKLKQTRDPAVMANRAKPSPRQ